MTDDNEQGFLAFSFRNILIKKRNPIRCVILKLLVKFRIQKILQATFERYYLLGVFNFFLFYRSLKFICIFYSTTSTQIKVSLFNYKFQAFNFQLKTSFIKMMYTHKWVFLILCLSIYTSFMIIHFYTFGLSIGILTPYVLIA